MSALVQSEEISELPLNGRNAYQLAQLGPGVFPTMGVVSQSSGSNAGSSFAVNGQSHRGNNSSTQDARELQFALKFVF